MPQRRVSRIFRHPCGRFFLREAKEIPVWLSQLRQSSGGYAPKKEAERPKPETKIGSRLSREVEALRRCIDWLQRLERGEHVIVNLRLDTDVETEFVSFDRPRVVRVLERIAADLDNLGLVPNHPQADNESNQDDPQARHRRELAEPSREPKKLSHREQRTALRSSDYRQSKKRDCVFRTLNALCYFLFHCSRLPEFPHVYLIGLEQGLLPHDLKDHSGGGKNSSKALATASGCSFATQCPESLISTARTSVATWRRCSPISGPKLPAPPMPSTGMESFRFENSAFAFASSGNAR